MLFANLSRISHLLVRVLSLLSLVTPCPVWGDGQTWLLAPLPGTTTSRQDPSHIASCTPSLENCAGAAEDSPHGRCRLLARCESVLFTSSLGGGHLGVRAQASEPGSMSTPLFSARVTLSLSPAHCPSVSTLLKWPKAVLIPSTHVRINCYYYFHSKNYILKYTYLS